MYVSEVAVAFTNDNGTGGCDHNLYVDHVTLATAAGPITLPAKDSRNVIFDRGTSFFDNVDVSAADNALSFTGALRFFIAPAPFHAPRGITTGQVQSPLWSYSLTGPVTSFTNLWTGTISVTDASTLFLSTSGHWQISGGTGWCYGTITVDGISLAAPGSSATCTGATAACQGAIHTYTPSWEAYTTSGFMRVGPGVHTLGLAVTPSSGTTCSVNGARIYYAALPN
jgi:hypothetical protein